MIMGSGKEIENYKIARLPDYKINGRRSFRPSPVAHLPKLCLGGRPRRPSLRVTNYAAWPAVLVSLPAGCVPSTVAPPTLTLICFGLASAFLGKVIFKTPLSY